MKTMKTLILILCSAFTSAAMAQSEYLTISKGRITYEQILRVDSLKADELFDKVRLWTVKTFRNSEKVITGEQKPVMLTGTFTSDYPWSFGEPNTVWHDFTIQVKDGAVKFSVTQMTTHGYNVELSVLKKDDSIRSMYQKTYNALGIKLDALAANLSETLHSKSSDW